MNLPDFASWSGSLGSQGVGWPRFVLDRSRLEANIDRVRSMFERRNLRLVLKSLSSPALIDYLMERTGTRRLMAFHLPFLLQAAARWPASDIMLGKPLPIAAVESFYSRIESIPGFDHQRSLHWLVDTPQRVAAHAAIARRFGVTMQVAIELDVGMHRGGANNAEQLWTVLDAVAREPDVLRVTGFMGYDAHAGKGVPWQSRRRSVSQANARYRRLLLAARESHSLLLPDDLIINGGGSPTCVFHDQSASPLNELAIGSVFVKPAEFDLPQLVAFEPACWLAAPVIKRLAGVRIPFLEWLSALSHRDTLFIYGGRWNALPCWPEGMRESRVYGPSFNQQLLTVPRSVRVQPEDFVFFRPVQSESLMTALGDILLIDDGVIVDEWPVLEQQLQTGEKCSTTSRGVET